MNKKHEAIERTLLEHAAIERVAKATAEAHMGKTNALIQKYGNGKAESMEENLKAILEKMISGLNLDELKALSLATDGGAISEPLEEMLYERIKSQDPTFYVDWANDGEKGSSK